MSSLKPLPLSSTLAFNWIFLVEILVVIILALFFLFYFNRLFAAVISYAIRAYTWNAYKAYIDIQALQISPLGGRIFFKSIRYHAHNVTVYVHEGHITWRYWLRLVRQAEVFQEERRDQPSGSSAQEKDNSQDEKRAESRKRHGSIDKEERAGGKPKKELPCRVSVKVSGVEAFIYNRSPVYDAVVEATLGKKKAPSPGKDTKGDPSLSPPFTPTGSSTSDGSPSGKSEPKRMDTRTTVGSSAPLKKPSIPAFLRVFPIKVECKRAAAAVGNENTKNIITAKAERAAGVVDAGHAGELDLWKLLFNFDIQNVVVAMRPNRDFSELQLDAGRRVIRQRETETGQPNKPVQQTIANAQSIWSKMKNLFRPSESSNDSLRTASVAEGKSFTSRPPNPPLDQMQGRGQWHGLLRYLDQGEKDEHDEWQQVEYAKASELVNIPKITFRFFWDMPGLVGDATSDDNTPQGTIYHNDINGAPPPEYGMELGVYGGFVVYGPWADRQRFNLQPIFVPATYADTTPAKPLQPGQLRVSTIFKIVVLVEEDVTLRIPTREESKDSKWKGRSSKPTVPEAQGNETSNVNSKHWRRHKHGFRRKGKKGPAISDARPYGWIDIMVKKDSVINYNMDMYPRSTGFRNTLDLDVKGLEMSSSVNHGLLWRSGVLTLEADLSQPAAWNTLRKWPFNIVINDMELFILRDHLFLIIDIVNDWASGAPSEFYTFVPYYYQIGLNFNNFVMYLNVNDANIVNDPADFDRNDYLTIEGQLRATLDIPMENYRPKRNQISYDVVAHNLKMRMHSSVKSTLNTFVEDKTMAELPKLTLNGSFNGNQEAQVGNVDVLRFDIVGTGLNLKAYGFYIRQLVSLKENYFGDYMHFKTLEEFQGASDDPVEANDKTASFPKPTSINELDVILCIVAEDVTVLLPTNLYTCQEFVKVELPRADLDLRIVSYYLDMGLQLSPVSILTGTSTNVDERDSPDELETSTQFYCRHVELNGHRSFGLPPNEEAYVSQWNIDIGKITGEMSSRFVRNLALAGRASAFSINDAENAAPLVSPAVVLDATFVQVQTDLVRLWMHIDDDAFLLDLDPVKVETSDWASSMFSQRVSVLAPLVTVACVDRREADRHRKPKQTRQPIRTYAFLQTGVSLDVVGRKYHFELETKRQQGHFKLHDQRTSRFPFLVRPEIDAAIDPKDEKVFEPPAIPYPFPPQPLRSNSKAARNESVKSLRSMASGRQLGAKSSCSSLTASIRSGRPATSTERPDLVSKPTNKTGSDASKSFHSLRSGSRNPSPASDGHITRRKVSNDGKRETPVLSASTMAFSSPYTEPCFPSEMVRPDETDVPSFTAAGSEQTPHSDASSSVSELVGDPQVVQELERTTIMIKVVPGIRAYIEPRVAVVVSKLMESIVPSHPEEIMDAFQMSVMGDIQTNYDVENANSKVIEIQGMLPLARIRLVVLDNAEDEITDRLELQLRGIETSVRLKSERTPSGIVQSTSLHTLLGGLDLEVAERRDSMMSPAVKLSIDDALVWLALTTANAFHVSIRETSLRVDGVQAKYLSQLALKLVPIVNDIKTRFESILSHDTMRLGLLTYVLTQNGEDFGDPPFMARLMYLLRAFPQHFRNTDSWKILARFRWILKNLPSEISHSLRSRCTAGTLYCPEDAPRLMLESWKQWRNWDVAYVNQTTAFKMLFGAQDAKDMDASDQKATTVTFRSESLQIAIEHGTNRSDILFEETSLGMENLPPTKPAGLRLVDENTRTKTVLQVHANTVAFLLDWSLFHIADDVLSLRGEIEAVSAMLQSQGSRTAEQALEEGLARHDVNVVLSINTGSVTMRTINLRHLARADGLKVSLIGTTQAAEQLGQCVSVILNADTAITELHGPTSRIWQSLLTSASLYVDSLQPKSGIDIPPTITVATAYNKLQIVVSEQIPGILHIIDAIILDEVAKISHLVEVAKAIQPTSRSPPTDVVRSSTGSKSMPPKVHVAILSGKLLVEISLLSTLSYLLEGTALSARVAPSLSNDNVFSIDFDVGHQSHAFVNTSSDESHTQELLEVPPINGHVGLELRDDETSVFVATTIEKVEVNAEAIQGVIAVFTRSEVQEVMSAIKNRVKDIQQHVEEVFPEGHAAKPKADSSRHVVVYDAKLALLGVRISASTPHFKGNSAAEVEFGIGPLHAKASNRQTPRDAIPQVLANVQDIGASLKIKDRGQLRPCGNLTFNITIQFSNQMENGAMTREVKVHNDGLEINVFPETAATVVDVINHLQDRIRHLDLSKEVDYLRRVRDQRRNTVFQRISGKDDWSEDQELPFSPENILSLKTTVELKNLQACWLVDPSFAAGPQSQVDDLIFSIASVEFTTRKGHEARLTIMDMQLKLCKKSSARAQSLNSALLPEVEFTVGYWTKDEKRHLAFKAKGEPLDLRLESRFLLPTNALQRSIEMAVERFKKGAATWEGTPTTSGAPRSNALLLDSKHLGSVLVEANFAGARVHMQGSSQPKQTLAHLAAASHPKPGAKHGRYGQFAAEGALVETSLTAPGFAFKVEYNSHKHQPVLNGELKIEASSNMLLPNVVPLIMEVSNSIKEVVRNQKIEPAPVIKVALPDPAKGAAKSAPKFFEEGNIVAVTPAKIFGKTKVDLGFRICKQEFALSCQPIARVDAKASLEDLYITMNTIDSDEHGHFFAMSAVVTELAAQVKHVYSREPTFSYHMDSIVLSAMNNKHLSGTPGISAILNFNPTKIVINGKQFQDLLLFREIWLPPEIRNATATASPHVTSPSYRPDEIFVQKYQTVAAAVAFPWNATVSIKKLAVDLDLGQSIGKSSFTITNLWAAQHKTSKWEQNLCIGMEEMAVHSTGRMSGFIELKRLGIRTSIHWPDKEIEDTMRKTPLIQASIGFEALRAKAAFDYQAFAFGDIGGFDFLMYNVRDLGGKSDRLVTVLDCEKAYVFCTSTSPAQAVGLFQAFDRLVQEKQTAYEQSLKDIEKHLRRESTVVPTRFGPQIPDSPVAQKKEKKSPISLHTDVVVTMGAVSFGVFPSTFLDSQMLKLEANNIQARSAVGLGGGRITSGLGMTLGELQVALSSVRRITTVPKALEVTVDEVVSSALNSKGGIILRVPKVIASMQTWQSPDDNRVDYIFKSLFEGKIDVGWNLNRINFIKNMWMAHSRALASRLGKSLPESAVKITAATQKDNDSNEGQEKITAEINLPQSRYEYRALEPPVIETPQLRDMGEATPPLEWIGLHRDRLPNVTHQIIIVSLLEVCREVEDAYGKILGSS